MTTDAEPARTEAPDGAVVHRLHAAAAAGGRGRPDPAPRLLREVYGDILRDERRDQDRTLRDVADTVGMSKQYLSEIERGRKEPSSEILGSVCDALDLAVEDLLARGVRRITAERVLRTATPSDRPSTLRARDTAGGTVVMLAA